MSMDMIIKFIGGLALFLYGMHVLGDGLEKTSGGKLESILERLTTTPLAGILLGTFVTAVIQSSSATTVMVVGFVNSGIMTLSRAAYVIVGANMGTCITAWILSMSALKGSGIVELFKPANFSPFLAIIGVALLMFSKSNKKKNIGIILTGFGVLMIGMDTMSGAMKGLQKVDGFAELMVRFSNPVLGMLVGLGLTAIIQSSSASVGILQALCESTNIAFATVIPVVLGQNIGTCVTALLSGIGAKRNAKRAAAFHLIYNICSALLFMILFYVLHEIFKFPFMEPDVFASNPDVAKFHTLFNVFKMAAVAPFTKFIINLATAIVKDDEEEKSSEYDVPELDVRFLDTPALAMEQCKTVAVRMSQTAKETLFDAMNLITDYSDDGYDLVSHKEELVDNYEDKLSTYMLKLSSKELSDEDSRQLSLLLHIVGDFERIADHGINIAKAARKMCKKKLAFSKKATEEMAVFTDLVQDIVKTSFNAFEEGDADLATYVEPMEEVVDKLNKEIKKRHVKRLRKGKCSVDMGFVLSDITTDYERISDHCSNIAVGIIQTSEDTYESHDYLDHLDKGEDTVFYEKYVSYKEKYVLP